MSPKLIDEPILDSVDRSAGSDDEALTLEADARRPVTGPPAALSSTIILVVACVLVQWIRVRDTYFVYDDFLFTRISQTHAYDIALLRMPLFEHFSPILWTMSKLMAGPFEMRHSLALVVGLSVTAWAIASMHRLVLRFSRSVVWAAALTLLYGLSILMTDILRWFTTSVHANLCAAFSLSAILFFVRYRDGGRRIDAVASVAMLAGALLTHEKGLLVVGYLALLWLTVYTPRFSARVIWEELTSHRYLWSTYLVLGGVSAVNFYANYYFGLPGASPADIGLFVLRSFTTSFIPSFFGVRYPEVGGYLGNSVKVVVVVALVLAIWFTLRSARRAIRGWIFLFTTLVVNFVVLGQARIAAYGAGSHHALQYQQEVAYLFPIGLAIVVGAMGWNRPHRSIRGRRGALVIGLAVLSGALYADVSMRSNDVVERSFDVGEMSRLYLDNLDRDAHALSSDGNGPSVLNSPVPDAWMSPAFVPYNLVSNISAVMRIPLVIGLHHSGQPTYRVGADGRLFAYDLVQDARVDVQGATILNGRPTTGDGACFDLDVGGAYVRFEAASGASTTQESPDPAVWRLSLRTSAPILFEVYGGLGGADLISDRGAIPAGDWEYDIRLTSGAFDHLDLHVMAAESSRNVCVRRAEVGVARPS